MVINPVKTLKMVHITKKNYNQNKTNLSLKNKGMYRESFLSFFFFKSHFNRNVYKYSVVLLAKPRSYAPLCGMGRKSFPPKFQRVRMGLYMGAWPTN